MLKRGGRVGIAVGGAILSLPAFFATLAGAGIVYQVAVLGGYNGSPLQAILKLLGSWRGWVMLLPVVLIIVHIVVFLYLLVRFARGLVLPRLAQLYCVTIVLLAVVERIRLQIVDGDVLFWYGVFSLPHVLCLFIIIWMRANDDLAVGSAGVS